MAANTKMVYGFHCPETHRLGWGRVEWRQICKQIEYIVIRESTKVYAKYSGKLKEEFCLPLEVKEVFAECVQVTIV